MSRERMQLLVATRNAHKTREFEELLGQDFEVSDLSAFPGLQIPEEIGRTFEENARLKAVAVPDEPQLHDLKLLVLADDFSLEVDAPGGGAGVFFAPFAGGKGTRETY